MKRRIYAVLRLYRGYGGRPFGPLGVWKMKITKNRSETIALNPISLLSFGKPSVVFFTRRLKAILNKDMRTERLVRPLARTLVLSLARTLARTLVCFPLVRSLVLSLSARPFAHTALSIAHSACREKSQTKSTFWYNLEENGFGYFFGVHWGRVGGEWAYTCP